MISTTASITLPLPSKTGDRVFQWLVSLVAFSVGILIVLVALKLCQGSQLAMAKFGWGFWSSTAWDRVHEKFYAFIPQAIQERLDTTNLQQHVNALGSRISAEGGVLHRCQATEINGFTLKNPDGYFVKTHVGNEELHLKKVGRDEDGNTFFAATLLTVHNRNNKNRGVAELPGMSGVVRSKP